MNIQYPCGCKYEEDSHRAIRYICTTHQLSQPQAGPLPASEQGAGHIDKGRLFSRLFKPENFTDEPMPFRLEPEGTAASPTQDKSHTCVNPFTWEELACLLLLVKLKRVEITGKVDTLWALDHKLEGMIREIQK